MPIVPTSPDNIKVYYEIAKSSFLEGLAKGLKL